MPDIFLSYSSQDRDRVQLIRDALAERGFEVFWDQTLPAGIDWDTWIRQHLATAKCALVVWSKTSVVSRNVRHEAKIATDQNKLVPVMIDELAAEEFPMGLYAFQCAPLAHWKGDQHDDEWLKVTREVEAKLMPHWVKRSMDRVEAELYAEQARRKAVEGRDRTLREQIEKEARTQANLKNERDRAIEDIAALKEQLGNVIHERDRALEETAAAKDQLANVMRERDRALNQLANVTSESDRAREQFAAAKEKPANFSRKEPEAERQEPPDLRARFVSWWEARSKLDKLIWFFVGPFLLFIFGLVVLAFFS